VKTYPQPSTKHRETTCVAALNRQGALRRLFPVTFRFIDGDMQFQKWEWVRANVLRAHDDRRPESHKLDVDSIIKVGAKIGTNNGWEERKKWVEPHILENFEALEKRRQDTGETLGILRPTRLTKLEVTAVKNPDWTSEEKEKLSKECLFDTDETKSRPALRKLPFDFHYHYECETTMGVETNRHKITDWEAGALYWNCVHNYGPNWERPFRARLQEEFAKKDLMLLMGTIHRFPGQWLIVGLIYPPKRKIEPQLQLAF
ncbi:MAG: hypothetical protein JWN98_2414, partial [Abditibacteriota bacterium]|nr:hypothetical protein [Abditibacteriota bacterium]